ncbi:efflux RND transporter periplasmic adaptor subunit [Planctomycetaceae bacterium SH139]
MLLENAGNRLAQEAPTAGDIPASNRRAKTLAGQFSSLFSGLGPLLVLLGFAGIFYYGHSSDWQVPKFATLVGTATVANDDWCSDHAVPESRCVNCQPELAPPAEDFGWCQAHGIHNCVLDYPQLAQVKQQSAATQLVLDRLSSDRQQAELALAVAPRRENNSLCTLYRSRIQFASVEAVQQAGVDIDLVARDAIIESVSGNGEIVYDPTRKSSVSARVPGNVWSVERNIGDTVRHGEILALIDATAVGTLKSNLLRALAEERLQRRNVARLKDAIGAVAGARVLEAEAALSKSQADVLNAEQALLNLGLAVDTEPLGELSPAAAMRALRLLGIPPASHSKLNSENITSNLLPIFAPMDGTIISREVSMGELVDSSKKLFEIADTKRMWLKLSVPLEQVERLAIGQKIRFTPDGSERTIEGQLDWISTGANQKTRMIEVRAALENPHGSLRDQTFGAGQVVLRESTDAIVIPSAAAHWEGCCQVVFVRDKNYFGGKDSPKLFHVRSVRLGATHQGNTEVIAGLLPGEVVAVSGSNVLRAQLLKNGLGAGCCVEE